MACCRELNAKLAAYKGTPDSLKNEAKISYWAARRYLLLGAKKRTKTADLLCIFFKIDLVENAKVQNAQLDELTRLIENVWDGTPSHAALLARLIRSTRSFTVVERR